MKIRKMNEKLFKLIKILLWIIPALIIIVFAFKYFGFTGELKLENNFKNRSPLLSGLSPSGRVLDIEQNVNTKEYYQRMRGEPVYFDVILPRPFQEVTINVTYQNESQDLFQLGIQKKDEKWSFDIKPVEYKPLDELSWEKIKENDLILWQKEKKYESISRFIEDLDSDIRLAVWNVDVKEFAKIPDYTPLEGRRVIDTTLRDDLDIFTYLKDEPLDFIFYYQDINRNEGEDLISIQVIKGGKVILENKIPDDGEIKATGRASPLTEIHIFKEGLSEGVYEIKITTSSDIFWRKIDTKQHKIVFRKNLYPAQNEEYKDSLPEITTSSNTFYTNSKKVNFIANHSSAFQRVYLSWQRLDINEVYKTYTITDFSDFKTIYLPKSNIKIFFDGYLAFDRNQFFIPEGISIKRFNSKTNLEEIDYILARYSPPEKIKNNIKRTSKTFGIHPSFIKDGKMTIIFSAPGIDKEKKEIILKNIQVILKKEPLTFKNFWPRLKRFLKTKFKK